MDQNVRVAERELSLWKQIRTCVAGVKQKKRTKTFAVVKEHVDNPYRSS